ncbi:MAG: hypothetical protein GY716_07355 [bacterium]|nr:hypothetical protein [bacterium]
MTKQLNNEILERVNGAVADFAPPENGPGPRDWANAPTTGLRARYEQREGVQQDVADMPNYQNYLARRKKAQSVEVVSLG